MTNREAVLPLIEKVDYQQMGKRTMVCLITCKNGFEIVGSTAIAEHLAYNDEVGLPLIEKVDYQQMGKRTMVCLITCKNGFEIVGSTAIAEHLAYNDEVGRYWALENAVDKLIRYATFHIMQKKIE